jgi:hypothetical protein
VDGIAESSYQVHLPSGGVFATQPLPAPDFDETFAFAILDDDTLMGVYTDGDQVMRAELFDHFGNALDEAIVLGAPRVKLSKCGKKKYSS